MTKISVCIPTHDRVEYLKMAVKSVLNQSYDNFQIIISDNSNNDKTKNYFSNFNNDHIKYYHVPYLVNPVHNQAHSVQKANSEYVTFLTDDDLFTKDYLKGMIETITQKKINFVRSNIKFIDTKGSIIGEHIYSKDKQTPEQFIYSRINQKIMSGLAGYMFRRVDYLKVGGLKEVGFDSGLYADDFLWYRLIIHVGGVETSKTGEWMWRKNPDNLGSKANLDTFISKVPQYINLLDQLFRESDINIEYEQILMNYKKKLVKSRIEMNSQQKKYGTLKYYLELLKYRKYI